MFVPTRTPYALLDTQRFYRIYGRRPPSRNIGSEQRHDHQSQCSHYVRHRVDRAHGEEFAWRGYIFRRLARENNNLVRAVLVSGTVWWAWHLPMFWLSPVLSALRPLQLGLTVTLSGPAILATAFMHSWVYVRSGTIWAPTIMHLFWNLYRATLTGRLADGEPGLFAGDLWLVNGEGVVGMIVIACFGFVFFALMVREQKALRARIDPATPC